MRVFYMDEDEDEFENNSRQYLITIENIDIPEHLKGTKVFDAKTIIELKTMIIKYYGFNLPDTIKLQLWSGPTGTNCICLDNYSDISKINNIWVKAINITESK